MKENVIRSVILIIFLMFLFSCANKKDEKPKVEKQSKSIKYSNTIYMSNKVSVVGGSALIAINKN